VTKRQVSLSNCIKYNCLDKLITSILLGEFRPQGYVEISVEVLPQKTADKLHNGFGREARNMYPVLPDPTGRFNFDFFSPWKMFKEIFGKRLSRKII